jgi:hypothetical protein
VAELTDVRVALVLGGLATGLATAWTARQMRAPVRPRPAAGLVAMATDPAAGFREVA